MNATQTDTAAPAVAGRVIENVSHGEVLERQTRASASTTCSPTWWGARAATCRPPTPRR
jgi:hypothetical protein